MMIVAQLREMGFEVRTPMIVHCDNNSAVQTFATEVAEWRSPTLGAKYWHCRDYIDDGDIVVKYIPSDDNNSDIHTKPLDASAHYRHATWMGMTFDSSTDADGS